MQLQVLQVLHRSHRGQSQQLLMGVEGALQAGEEGHRVVVEVAGLMRRQVVEAEVEPLAFFEMFVFPYSGQKVAPIQVIIHSFFFRSLCSEVVIPL